MFSRLFPKSFFQIVFPKNLATAEFFNKALILLASSEINSALSEMFTEIVNFINLKQSTINKASVHFLLSPRSNRSIESIESREKQVAAAIRATGVLLHLFPPATAIAQRIEPLTEEQAIISKIHLFCVDSKWLKMDVLKSALNAYLKIRDRFKQNLFFTHCDILRAVQNQLSEMGFRYL